MKWISTYGIPQGYQKLPESEEATDGNIMEQLNRPDINFLFIYLFNNF